MAVELEVKCGDVTQTESDVLLLKYARSFHGADASVASALAQRSAGTREQMRPEPWEGAVLASQGAIAAERVLFLGTPGLGEFRYREMERFARQALAVLRQAHVTVGTLTTTVHGAGYGLDVEESLQAMIHGFQQGLADGPVEGLARITFVEINRRRADLLAACLRKLPSRRLQAAEPAVAHVPAPVVPAVPEKRRVFVAMAFAEEFEDIYQFGIYDVVRRCGYICERVDEKALTGSIVDHIEEGIRNADFVVADLTGERPNVYLEVGYAWGIKQKVLLVAKEGTKLHFDLSHHKCIFYRNIIKLAEELEKTIRKLGTS